MAPAASGEDADLVVLNTCHIREKAAEKAYSDVGRLRREDGSRPLIALAGCVAQAAGSEAQSRSKMIDIVAGPQPSCQHHPPNGVVQLSLQRDALVAVQKNGELHVDLQTVSKVDL
jgi:tRNA-2-methylthio-N6-dimethylallyladenosine synthase